MPRQSVAAQTQRPVRPGGGEGSVQADGLLRTFSAAASLALLLRPLTSKITLGAAPPPASMPPKSVSPAAASTAKAAAPDTLKVALRASELPATGDQLP